MNDPFLPKLHRWLVGIVFIYTALLVSWYGVTTVAPESHWLFSLSTIFGSWFFAPLLLLLPWVLVWRHWRLLLVLCIPLALFSWDYGRQFLPQWPTVTEAISSHSTASDQGVPAQRTHPPVPLRVMSWNGYFRNSEPSAFVATIEELQPDLVAVQEINNTLATAAAEQLQDLLPYQQIYPTGTPSGMGILSRHPILASRPPDFDRCNCQTATIDLNGQPISMLSVHPWPPYLWLDRYSQPLPQLRFSTTHQDYTFDGILEHVQTLPHPLLVMGDLNTTERQTNYRRLRSQLHDTFVEAGWGMGYTFPTVKRVYGIPVFPAVRIDYIFHDAAWQTESAWVGTIPGADHRYIAADLLLLGE